MKNKNHSEILKALASCRYLDADTLLLATTYRKRSAINTALSLLKRQGFINRKPFNLFGITSVYYLTGEGRKLIRTLYPEVSVKFLKNVKRSQIEHSLLIQRLATILETRGVWNTSLEHLIEVADKRKKIDLIAKLKEKKTDIFIEIERTKKSKRSDYYKIIDTFEDILNNNENKSLVFYFASNSLIKYLLDCFRKHLKDFNLDILKKFAFFDISQLDKVVSKFQDNQRVFKSLKGNIYKIDADKTISIHKGVSL